jgi:hypothetical protein
MISALLAVRVVEAIFTSLPHSPPLLPRSTSASSKAPGGGLLWCAPDAWRASSYKNHMSSV